MNLPGGWALTTIGEVLTGVEAGRSEQTLERRPGDGEVGVIKVSAVTWGDFDPDEAKAIPADRFDPSKAIRKGDLLFSRANTMNLVGAVVHVASDHPHLMLSDKILRLRLSAGVAPRFVMFALRTAAARKHLEQSATGTSTSMRNVTQDSLRAAPLPLAPAEEQRRIVAKLDAVFAQTRATKARLERLPALIEKLKRAILAAAFRGDLTADWRAANPDVEPASVLAARIREQRDDRTAVGSDSTPSSTLPDLSLPSSWVVAPTANVGSVQLGRQRSDGKYQGELHPYLRVANVADDRISFEDLHEMEFSAQELEHYRLRPGDIVLSEGQSLDRLGQSAMYRSGDPPVCFQKTLNRFRATMAGPIPEYAQLYFRFCMHTGVFRAAGSITTNIAHLTQEKLRRIPFILCPLAEQRVLVERVRGALARLESARARVTAAFSTLTAIEQAALAKAFRGELVPQDPADEPAAMLLERIRAAMANEPASTRRPRTPAAAAAPYVVPPGVTLAQAAESGPLFKHAHDRQQRAATDAPTLDLVVAALQQSDARLTAAAITQATGLDAAAVRQALKDLVAAGQVRTHGKARGTSYEWLQ